MEPFRMTAPRFDRLLLALCALYFVGLSHAIYDPHGTTTKPPSHREPELPWYLSGKAYPEPTEDTDLSRSPKWQVDPDEPRKPLIVEADTKAWTPWRKGPASDIEQRTEINGDRRVPVDTDQNRDWFWESDQFEQQPSKPPVDHSQHPSAHATADDKSTGNRPRGRDTRGPPGHGEDFYEGLTNENTKPRKEQISLSTGPKATVARYDAHRGVMCPEEDATGQFVYPPDCKFFVNCWKGRAFVQPCAPGTLFNPESLECDFPHKVKCYGGEIADFPSPHSPDSTGRREPLVHESQAHPGSGRLQALPQPPKCPAHVTGLLPHPTDCTKFLQCANGGGHVMDCGPGTVFNPAVSVCDWPRNVRGCEGAYKSPEDEAHEVPPNQQGGKTSEYNSAREPRKIACPPGYTGLLPHPETCKKFLQCANGITYVMDCGPGTAFNPLTTVCDWPYNVPGCSEEKPALQVSTTSKPWSSGGQTPHSGQGHYQPGWSSGRDSETTPKPWSSGGQTHSDHGHYQPGWSSGRDSETTPKPWSSGGQTPHSGQGHYQPGWSSGRDSETTPKPWSSGGQTPHSGQGHYQPGWSSGRDSETTPKPWSSGGQTPHSGQGHYQPGWSSGRDSVTTTPKPWPSGSQTPPGHGHYQPGWSSGHDSVTPEPWSSGVETSPGHGHHQPGWSSGHGSVTTNPTPPDWDSHLRPTWKPTWKPETWTSTPHYHDHTIPDNDQGRDRNYYDPPTYQEPTQEQHQQGPPNYPHHQHHHQHNHQYHHRPTYNPDANTEYPDQYDRQQPQGSDSVAQETNRDSWYPTSEPHWKYPTPKPGYQSQTRRPDPPFGAGPLGHPVNRTRFQEGNNGRTNTEPFPNRQAYGRNIPGPHRSPQDRAPAPDGNVYVENDYDGSGKEEPIAGVWSSRTNKTELIWPSRNRTFSGKPEVPQGAGGFKPSGWRPQGQEETRPSLGNQPRTWDQGGIDHDDKLREWETRTNIYQQSTADNEADRKLDQWPSKANIPPYKGPSTSGGSYESANGTRGHFITKGVEVNQGHSNTRTFGSNEPAGSPNNTSGSFRPRTDTRTNRAFNFSNQTPTANSGPPFYRLVNNSHGAAVNLSGVPTNQPVYHLPDRLLPPPEPADSLSSGAANRHVTGPPVTIYYPPYFNYTGHSHRGSTPGKPSGNLEPPLENWGNHYPAVPASELQPPHYQPPKTESGHGFYPSVPSTDMQPPDYDSNNWLVASNTTSGGSAYAPGKPSSDLEPPIHQFGGPNSAFKPRNVTHYQIPSRNLLPPLSPVNPSTPRANKTELGPEKPAAPVKKKILQDAKPKLHALESRFAINVPTVSIEDDAKGAEVEDPTEELQPAPKESVIMRIPAKKPDVERVNVRTTPPVAIASDKSPKEAEDVKNSTDFPTPVEPSLDVDVLDETQVWKPVLVFQNKTTIATSTESVIMKIGTKKGDVDLFNVEAAPFRQDEPPFPSYYIPMVEPLSHAGKISVPTPISGQVVRLRGGPGPQEGYVEVQGVNPGWGVVCDTRNSWTIKEAHVVCRQLGYTSGAEMAWQGRSTRGGVPSWIAANSVVCSGNETRFQSCKFTHEATCRVERDAIGVRCIGNRVAHCRQDEIPHGGQCYHLVEAARGLNHGEALGYCTERQSRLIDITNQLENDFISEWLQQKHPAVESVMTSGVGFTMLKRPVWLWGDSSRAKFRFAKWWPGWMGDGKQSPAVTSRPACVVMKRKFPCHENPGSMCVADYFFWDTVDCTAAPKGHSYICKKPYEDIGCKYGKGNQYAGTANVTASGKHCLPWADPKVAHRLAINVVNREVREKLKGHNYCRNPNPNKESQPWCFSAPTGDREYCDIPPCGNIGQERSLMPGQCKPKHFECSRGECIPSPWVCDGEEDCTNGADEKNCKSHLSLFQKSARHKLEGYDVEKWLNTPLKTCALRCKEADFTCRSFAHKAAGNICLLSDNNVGMSGSLVRDPDFDYYEMKERSLNCDEMFVCGNGKCINQTKVCNGKNDCRDRSDENACTVENLNYGIRLAGSNNSHEGRIEVRVFGVWGQVCDDGFGMINAEVICKELGHSLGALEVRPGGFYGNLEPPTTFMVDQLKCRGNETSLRECDFDGWGVHNCQPEEAVGVVCKTAVNSCQDGYWKCDNSPTCIPTAFICDYVTDCPDGSDESTSHCNAPFELRLANGSSPLEGRVEVRRRGIWGTVCDDDFSTAAATVICRSLGYAGQAIPKKNGFFGPGQGPIWLDEVSCHGNETQLNRCGHNDWGKHNCDHNEDAGVICTTGDVDEPKLSKAAPSVNDLLPANCGKRFKDFNDDEDQIFAKVVHGSIAAKGTYPWQASIRVRGHSRSSHWCGAVMLSPLHVLTAAHCLEGYNKATYLVRAGDYNTEIDEGTEVEANIEDYYIHEDFRNGHRMNNDIALVLLKGRGIPLGRDIMPICLPHENTEYPAGLNCTISGFGSLETGKTTHSKDLRYGWVPLLDQSLCRADYIYGADAISDGMVCAGYLDEGVDTCDGDSGGPLACYHNGAFTLYGITSWGLQCGKANKPGVYVRVSHYRQWIEEKIKESLAGR